MRMIRNWKLIFGTNLYHCIFVEDRFNKCIHVLLDNILEIKKEKDICIILPSIYDLQNKDFQNSFQKHSMTLKNFFDSEQSTLVIHEEIFDILIKDEKKISFFKFVYKKKKSIFILYDESKNSRMNALFLSIQDSKSYKKHIYYHDTFLKTVNLHDSINYINQYVFNLNKFFKNPLLKNI